MGFRVVGGPILEVLVISIWLLDWVNLAKNWQIVVDREVMGSGLKS